MVFLMFRNSEHRRVQCLGRVPNPRCPAAADPQVMVNPTDPSIPINPMPTAPVDTAAIVNAGGDPVIPPEDELPVPVNATVIDRLAVRWNNTVDALLNHNVSDFTVRKARRPAPPSRIVAAPRACI